jgi:beta-phosphoglucomutase
MQWIHNYQLFLFDFDGLLVNTEELHFLAYRKMCEERGFPLDWSFERFSLAAHYKSTDLRDHIYQEFPELRVQEPDWSVLYAEKKKALLAILETGGVTMMPGATELLLALKEANIMRSVVTHSPTSLINLIRAQNPILDTIPHWITREDYTHPKPDPECYQTAIKRLAKPGDKVIGFEDSPRGLHALLGTEATAVLVCSFKHPNLSPATLKQVKFYSNLTEISDDNAP